MTTIEKIEAEAALKGWRMSALCKAAGVNYSTWWRWKSNRYEPRAASVSKLRRILQRKYESPCTTCGRDAEIGFSDWVVGKKVQLIRKDERLCVSCAKKRGIHNPFSSNKDPKESLNSKKK